MIAAVVKRSPEYYPITKGLMSVAPKTLFMDDDNKYDYYEALIWFHNRPPNIKTKAKVAWWMCDLRKPEEVGEGNPDVIFLCNTEYIDDYKKFYGCPVHYMPQTGLVEPVRGREIEHDAVFIGNLQSERFHSNRKPVIDKIATKYSVLTISGERFTPDTYWLYNQTTFSLSISTYAKGFSSNRLYNILSAGGFALVACYPQLEKDFKDGKHVAIFHDPEEALLKMNYYMVNPKKREKIRQAGYKLYREKHTPKKRFEAMLKILKI